MLSHRLRPVRAATDNEGIVEDLMALFSEWSKDHFEFHTAPVYLFWCAVCCSFCICRVA